MPAVTSRPRSRARAVDDRDGHPKSCVPDVNRHEACDTGAGLCRKWTHVIAGLVMEGRVARWLPGQRRSSRSGCVLRGKGLRLGRERLQSRRP
jgi:hypothetical protein